MPPDAPPRWLATYLEAAGSFADLVALLPPALEGPGLGDWDLRALVGHTSRSLVTVSEYLRKPASSVAAETAVDYIAGLAGTAKDDEGVNRRGVEAGEMLGNDPAGAVRLLLDAVSDDLARAKGSQLVTTYVGGMRLRDYLPTRTFELVVHGLDIAAAARVSWTPPPAALAKAVSLAGKVAVRRGEGTLLLRLSTGREPGGLSIV